MAIGKIMQTNSSGNPEISSFQIPLDRPQLLLPQLIRSEAPKCRAVVDAICVQLKREREKEKEDIEAAVRDVRLTLTHADGWARLGYWCSWHEANSNVIHPLSSVLYMHVYAKVHWTSVRDKFIVIRSCFIRLISFDQGSGRAWSSRVFFIWHFFSFNLQF